MGDHASMARDPKGAEASDDTLKRVVHNLWGIPERTADLTRRRAAGGRASHWDNRRSTTALTCRCPVARTCLRAQAVNATPRPVLVMVS
jgi:hypothetical protein